MVLATNEWLNFCEDEQKSANNANATTATTTTAVTTTTTAVGTTGRAATATTTTANRSGITAANAEAKTAASISIVTANPAATEGIAHVVVGAAAANPTASDNANNEAFFKYEQGEIIIAQTHQQPLLQQLQSKPPPPTYEEVLLLNTSNLKIMAETTNAANAAADNNIINIKSEFKVKQETPESETKTTTTESTPVANTVVDITAATTGVSTIANTTNESDNNNHQQHSLSAADLLSEAISEAINSNANASGGLPQQHKQQPEYNSNSNNTSTNSNSYSNNSNSNSNANSNANSNTNSNTNTLQSATLLGRASIGGAAVNNRSASPQQVPLSNPITPQELTNALHSVMSAHTATANNGALPNFLSSLGMAALQVTTKQFCDSNSAAAMGNSVTLDADGDVTGGPAKILLICEPNSHPFQTRTIQLTPNIECKVGRLIAKSKASEANAIFDCKVLSRNHAVLWYSDDGKFWVKDTKSSNGTFINESKLGTEAAELHFGDIVKFGVDVLENSRKEVHGCIIACVKLYLSDGREAISIDSHTQRSQFSGEGRVSFDELHRLNLYMQEASQREKVLKSKLYNIQNILDATKKNSALCWQSMIAEDQLLHRIHSLEKKLQIMEKNVPESVLKNEVIKLLDDKSSYQHTAKEALRKVYQERCDAMQMLSKMESAYTASDSECKILRDQIMCTKQSLQDVNTRLLRLEAEYNEYKDDCERQQQEAKELEQQRTVTLTEKLLQYEQECEELRRKIGELLLKRAEQLDAQLDGKDVDTMAAEQAQLEKQALEKLDAAIADMDLGDDDEDDEEDDDDDDNEALDIKQEKNDSNSSGKEKAKATREVNGLSVVDISSSSGDSEQEKIQTPSKHEKKPKQRQVARAEVVNKNKVVKESTILKWLQNSDLNKTEGSIDIFKAICNEEESSDSSDERDAAAATKTSPGNGAGTNSNHGDNDDDFERKRKITSKLQSVENNLKHLEAESVCEPARNAVNMLPDSLDDDGAVLDNDSDDEEGDDEAIDEFIMKRAAAGAKAAALSKENKSFLLQKRTVSILREAYNDICSYAQLQQGNGLGATAVSPPTMNSRPMHTSLKSGKRLEGQDTLKPLAEVNSDEEAAGLDDDESEDYDDDDISDANSTPLSTCSQQTMKEVQRAPLHKRAIAQQQKLEKQLRVYESEVAALQQKLEQNENDAQNTLEIMQIESDAFKDKVDELTKLLQTLQEGKQRPPDSCNNSSSSGTDSAVTNGATTKGGDGPANTSTAAERTSADTAVFEQQLSDDLAAMNCGAVQREEELIMYKELLEQSLCDNQQLRNEISQIKLKANHDYTKAMLARILPYGVVVVGILAYFLTTYY